MIVVNIVCHNTSQVSCLGNSFCHTTSAPQEAGLHWCCSIWPHLGLSLASIMWPPSLSLPLPTSLTLQCLASPTTFLLAMWPPSPGLPLPDFIDTAASGFTYNVLAGHVTTLSWPPSLQLHWCCSIWLHLQLSHWPKPKQSLPSCLAAMSLV